MAMGSTRAMLATQFGLEMKHKPVDLARLDKIQHAWNVINEMQEKSNYAKRSASTLCAWKSVDACRNCRLPAQGKCLAMSTSAAA